MSKWPSAEAASRALPYSPPFGVNIDTLLEEDLDDIEVASIRSGLEGIAVLSAPIVNIGTLLKEALDNVEVASIRSGLEGIAVVSALGIDIGTFLEEDLDDVEVALR